MSPKVGKETPKAVLYRVSAEMLNVMQKELPRESDGQIHVRLAIAALGTAMARWLAVGGDRAMTAEAMVDVMQEEIRPLLVEILKGERERLDDEAEAKKEAH